MLRVKLHAKLLGLLVVVAVTVFSALYPVFVHRQSRQLALVSILILLAGGLLYLVMKRTAHGPQTTLHNSGKTTEKNSYEHRIAAAPGGRADTVNDREKKTGQAYEEFEEPFPASAERSFGGMQGAEERTRRLSEYNRDLAALSRLSTSVFSADLSRDDIMDRFMTAITRGLEYEQARLCIVDRKTLRLEVKREAGMSNLLPPCDHSFSGSDPLVTLVRAGRAVLFEDVGNDPDANGLYNPAAVKGPLSLAFLPILSHPNTKQCWEANRCAKTDCPAYNREDKMCWQAPNTLCRNDLVESYGDKLTYCMTCDFFPVIGVLIVASDPRTRPLLGRNMSVLRILTAEMGAAFESHRLHEDKQQILRQLLGLNKVTAAALSDLSLDKALAAFRDTAVTFPGLDACNFWLVSGDGRELVRKAGGCIISMDEDRCPERLPVEQGLLGTAFRLNKPVIEYNAVQKDITGLGMAMSAHGLNSLLAVPLSTEGRPIGIFSVYKKSTAPFLETEIASFMLLANQAAMAIDACILNEELKNQNVELARNIRLTQGILASMSSGVLLLDMEGRIKLVNLQGARILRCEHETMAGQKLTESVPEAAAFMETDRGTYREIMVHAPDGTPIPIGFSSTHSYGPNGEHEGVIVDYRDLTEIKALQSELLDKERFAAMGKVVAGVAHEIRNPLFGISSIAQIFERDLKKPAHREFVRALLSETRRLSRLSEELLVYGRPMKLALERCDLRKLWKEVLDLHNDEIEKKGITVTGDYDLRHPHAYLDAHQIRQVFLNLLRNSIEATPQGGKININLLLEDRYIIFKIADTGDGIPAKIKDRVFDLFFTTKPKGTGLGLAICRKIVQDHGGEITIESEEGKGTLVTVKLPYKGEAKNHTMVSAK